MRRDLTWVLLILLVVGGSAIQEAYAQASANGNVYAALYVSEDTATSQLYDAYAGVLLNAAPIASQRDFRVKADFRVAKTGDPADWNEKFFSLYADWRSKNRAIRARFGRQFLYRGVLNGSVDGLLAYVKPVTNLEIGAFGGLAVKYGNSLDLNSWDDGGTLGGIASYRFTPRSRIEASYVQRNNGGQVVWRQLGGSVAGNFLRDLIYNAQLDYNLERSEVQAGRLRLMYLISQWSISAEFNHQRPRVYQDSYFNVFELVAFNQIRGGAAYRFGRYSVGAAYLHTIYEESDSADQLNLTLGSSWGLVGVAFQSGYGGDRVGAFGNVAFDLIERLALTARASYYNYERRNIVTEQDATGLAAGLRYRLSPWLLSAEVQQSINSHFDSDWRGLIRAYYTFDFGPNR